VTRLVDRVVEAGLVVRENSPSDRCSIHGVLAPARHEMPEQTMAAHVERIDHRLRRHCTTMTPPC
jgi:hypothetical protein